MTHPPARLTLVTAAANAKTLPAPTTATAMRSIVLFSCSTPVAVVTCVPNMSTQEGVADFSNLGVRAATQLDPYFLQFAPQSAALADVQPATLGFVIQPCVTGELCLFDHALNICQDCQQTLN